MFFGDEKMRQMARSILPSTASRFARKRRAEINRKSRRLSRQLCHKALSDLESSEDFDFEDDLSRYEIRSMVSSRRESDKLAHFERWAIKITDHLGDDPSGRRAKIQAALPKGLIGWHASSHLAAYIEFRTQRASFRDYKKLKLERGKAKSASRLTRERAISKLREVLESPELVEKLRTHMQRKHLCPVWSLGFTRVRSLSEPNLDRLLPVKIPMGVDKPPILHRGNVASFVDQVFKANRTNWITPPTELVNGLQYPAPKVPDPSCHPEWLSALRSFLCAWEAGSLGGLNDRIIYQHHPWWET